jgi:hypothetical protein
MMAKEKMDAANSAKQNSVSNAENGGQGAIHSQGKGWIDNLSESQTKEILTIVYKRVFDEVIHWAGRLDFWTNFPVEFQAHCLTLIHNAFFINGKGLIETSNEFMAAVVKYNNERKDGGQNG